MKLLNTAMDDADEKKENYNFDRLNEKQLYEKTKNIDEGEKVTEEERNMKKQVAQGGTQQEEEQAEEENSNELDELD